MAMDHFIQKRNLNYFGKIINKMPFLPKHINKIVVPPIKCQGIKTKLISFISDNIFWDGNGTWIEPFLGSGVVAFNIQPQKAILCDTNRHIIKFYQSVQKNDVNGKIVRDTLSEMGNMLSKKGETYYYDVREKFNDNADSLYFLFLNRSCFNGLMRFNSKGKFNVPFCKKDNRFSKSYITKIVNQVNNIAEIINKNDWQFLISDYKNTLQIADMNDFVYLDPPYVGRHTDYYNTWSFEDAVTLSTETEKLSCKYALSMWLENKYRKNEHIDKYWKGNDMKTFSHFYHIGSKEILRNKMTEALLLKPNSVRNVI